MMYPSLNLRFKKPMKYWIKSLLKEPTIQLSLMFSNILLPVNDMSNGFVSTHKWWLIRKSIRVLANQVWPAAEPTLYDDPGAVAQAQAEHIPMATVSPSHPPPLLILALPSGCSCLQPTDLPSVFACTRHQLFQ